MKSKNASQPSFIFLTSYGASRINSHIMKKDSGTIVSYLQKSNGFAVAFLHGYDSLGKIELLNVKGFGKPKK